MWALGGYQNEYRGQTVAVPADNNWYLCRVDGDHGFLGDAPGQLHYGHTTLRTEIYNLSPFSNLDVDFASQSLYHVTVTGTTGDQQPDASPLGGCVLWTENSIDW
jgi:hypothetical protein